MSHFCEMDWTPRWDWENFAGFGSKAESPKKPQLLDWMIVDDGGETNGGSFNLSSDGGHVSSAKSSLSASTDSSVKDGLQTPNFKLMTSEAFSGNFSKKMVNSGSSPNMKASVDSVEPLIGLKLGKRTYFENNGAVESFTVMPTPSTTSSLKRTKSSGQNISIPRCVVEGCNVDLTTAKEYHRRHRVCDGHSKCPKVIVGGLERRFCQQCSRFHSLSEFDEKKRSCRRRLSDHNARRRKPQRETIQFSSGRLSSPFYGERKKLSFLLNNSPLIHSKYSADTTWDDSTCNSKFTLTKEYPLKSTSGGGLMHMPGTKLPAPHVNNTHGNAVLFASKSNVPEVFNPGSKGSLISSHLDASPDYGRALSLLSKNTWDPCGPENGITQPMIHNAIPEGVPLPSSDFWLHQPSAHPRFQSFLSNSNYQEIQLLVTPYEADLYSNILN